MKRFLALLITATIILSFSACGNNEDTDTITCWSCGETISNTAAYCANCGSAVADNPNNTEPSTTESTNNPTGGTEDSTQDSTEGTTGDTTNTTEPSTTTPPTTEAPHTHSYSSKVTTDATCGKDGVKTFTCSCGSSYTEKIAATGQHAWKSATCTTPKTCTTCSKTEGSAAGHSWGAWTTVIAAEVGKAGQEKRTCSSCKQSETREIPALQEDLSKKWFIAQYALAKQQYIDGLNKDIAEKQEQIDDVEKDVKVLDDNYAQEVIDIHYKYSGGSSSTAAARKFALQNAEAKYKSSLKVYTEKITALENEISAIEAEVSNPNVDKILTICAQNNNTSSKEIYEYYYKYSDSLS